PASSCFRISLLSTSRRYSALADCSWRWEGSIGFSRTRTAGVRRPRRKSNVRAPSPGSPAAPDGTHHWTSESPDANRHPAAARAVAKGFMSLDIAAPPEDVATCCIDQGVHEGGALGLLRQLDPWPSRK